MPRAGSPISIPTKLLATGVACALAIVVCGTAATVVVASDVTNRVNGPGRKTQTSPGAAGASVGGAFRDAGATAEALDSLLRPLGPPQNVDPKLATLFNAFNSDQSGSSVWAPAAPAESLPGPIPTTAPRRWPLVAALDSLNPAEMSAARASTRDAWLPAFRTWALSPRSVSLWGYRDGLPDTAFTKGLPLRSFNPWRSIFSANEYASLFALKDGKPTEAMRHALENIAASRHFIEQPVMLDALVGAMYLKRGLQLVAYIAQHGGDTATAHRALAIDSTAKNFASAWRLNMLALEGGNASSPVALQVIGDNTIHPALRVDAMRTITTGGCRSLPEVVFGFSQERRKALLLASAKLGDIDRGDELAERELKLLDRMMALDTAPETLPSVSVLERSAILNAFSWIVPPGVRARASLCLRQGYRSQGATVRENAVVGVH